MVWPTFRGDTATMTFRNSAANGKSDSGSFILLSSMKALKNSENSVQVFFIKPDPVVGYRQYTAVLFLSSTDFDPRGAVFLVKFQCICNKVLDQLAHLRRISINNREFGYFDFSFGLLNSKFQV